MNILLNHMLTFIIFKEILLLFLTLYSCMCIDVSAIQYAKTIIPTWSTLKCWSCDRIPGVIAISDRSAAQPRVYVRITHGFREQGLTGHDPDVPLVAIRDRANTLTSDASLVSCLALAYDAKGLIHILKLIYGDPVCTAFKHAVKLIFKCNSSPKEIKHANGILI